MKTIVTTTVLQQTATVFTADSVTRHTRTTSIETVKTVPSHPSDAFETIFGQRPDDGLPVKKPSFPSPRPSIGVRYWRGN